MSAVLPTAPPIMWRSSLKDCRSLKDQGNLRRRRRISASLTSNDSINQYHAYARNIAKPHAVQQVASRGMLCPVEKYQIRGAPDGDHTRVELPQSGRVPRCIAKHFFRRYVGHTRQQGDHAQNAKGLYPGACGAVSPENDTIGTFELPGMTSG